VSFETPEYTANSDALGTLRILEAIRILGLKDKTRFYQASTSEMFGKVQETPQRETTPFYPPLALRRSQGLRSLDHRELPRGLQHVCLQRHPLQPRVPDPRRDVRHAQDHPRALRIHHGTEECLYLGNMDSLRDWGHAKDYVRAQWLMLQQPEAEDFVIATGEQHSVRDFVSLAAAEIGIKIEWRGKGIDEQGVDTATGKSIVKIDPRYFRPTEVETLLGDPSKAKHKLGWRPNTASTTSFARWWPRTWRSHAAMRSSRVKGSRRSVISE